MASSQCTSRLFADRFWSQTTKEVVRPLLHNDTGGNAGGATLQGLFYVGSLICQLRNAYRSNGSRKEILSNGSLNRRPDKRTKVHRSVPLNKPPKPVNFKVNTISYYDFQTRPRRFNDLVLHARSLPSSYHAPYRVSLYCSLQALRHHSTFEANSQSFYLCLNCLTCCRKCQLNLHLQTAQDLIWIRRR